MRRAASILMCAVLAGCAPERNVLELTQTGSETYAVPYKAMADCLYPLLVEKYHAKFIATITMADLPTQQESRISADAQNLRAWQLRLRGRGPNETVVDYYGGGSVLFGPVDYPPEFADVVHACAHMTPSSPTAGETP